MITFSLINPTTLLVLLFALAASGEQDFVLDPSAVECALKTHGFERTTNCAKLSELSKSNSVFTACLQSVEPSSVSFDMSQLGYPVTACDTLHRGACTVLRPAHLVGRGLVGCYFTDAEVSTTSSGDYLVLGVVVSRFTASITQCTAKHDPLSIDHIRYHPVLHKGMSVYVDFLTRNVVIDGQPISDTYFYVTEKGVQEVAVGDIKTLGSVNFHIVQCVSYGMYPVYHGIKRYGTYNGDKVLSGTCTITLV